MKEFHEPVPDPHRVVRNRRGQTRGTAQHGRGTRVVVDLSAVEFIDSSGLGALISGLKVARQAGGDLRIAAPTRQVITVLELTNLNRVLRAHPDPGSAFDE